MGLKENYMKRLFGFTLAETLIVMGIIGVVAALTLPNLNSSTGDKEKVSKLQKIYSNLQDAFSRAEAVYGPVENWCPGCDNSKASAKFQGRLLDFLKVSKVCDSSSEHTCFTEYDDNGFEYVQSTPAFILSDGSSIILIGQGHETSLAAPGITADVPEKHVYGLIWVDLNGVNKGKNTGGDDIFSFTITSTGGIIPDGGEYCLDKFDPSKEADFLATAWVLHTGNMDYLKNKNGKCPDGKTVLNWTTNTTCK